MNQLNKSILFFCLAFLVNASVRAQSNLVPNGSFENFSFCPNSIAYFNCTDWFSPVSSSPDYYHECASATDAGVPLNIYGYQQAYDGAAYCGIVLNSTNEYREYVAIKLFQTLQPNVSYDIHFQVSLSNATNFGSNNFGVYFVTDTASLSTQISGSGNSLIISEADTCMNSTVFTDTNTWHKISDKYVARGGEAYMIIGNFNPQGSTLFADNVSNTSESYYYIDDVVLTESCDHRSPEIPNVFTPNGDNVNDVFEIDNGSIVQLAIVNRWGEHVFVSRTSTMWDGSSKEIECKEGTYFYNYEFTCNGIVKKKTGFIQLIR